MDIQIPDVVSFPKMYSFAYFINFEQKYTVTLIINFTVPVTIGTVLTMSHRDCKVEQQCDS